MKKHGIGLIHHVGPRKITYPWYDIIINPITEAFVNYELETDIVKFLLQPLKEGLQKVRNKSACAKDIDSFTIAIENFTRIYTNFY
jgi:hypothetical protein